MSLKLLRLINFSGKSTINRASSIIYRKNSNNSDNNDWNSRRKNKVAYTVVSTTLGAILGYNLYSYRKNKIFALKNENVKAGEVRTDLPTFTREEVAKHTTKESKIWVTYKNGVYDITKFVEGHPGGDQILMAAGNSVEPFWLVYGIHENPHVYKIIEEYRIGNLDEGDSSTNDTSNQSDPYANEPKRHPALIAASLKPFNAESPAALIGDHFITPNELFYVRNHLPVPEIDGATYELEIELEGLNKSFSFTLNDLKKMPKTTITATIMCAGNRRSEMTKVKPVKGLNWGPAAVGNATWTGVRLRDVLLAAGVSVDDLERQYKHIQFEGVDLDVTGKTYGASIPIWKGIDKRGDVILAYEMNGVDIPRDHGYPIRIIVPGTVGARNVKWLSRIVFSKHESDSHWQQNDYKGFSPSTDWNTVDFSKSYAIQELPVISAICRPSDGELLTVKDGFVTVKGYAWSGGGKKIIRVDVTVDQGKTWHVANLDFQDEKAEPPQHWAWTLWSIKVPVDKKTEHIEIWVKAVDNCYNTQPESFENIWNLRGVLSNAYHRIKVNLKHF